MTQETFIVARMKDGKPFDYLHSVNDAGTRHMCCTNPQGALRFEKKQAAMTAAGDCMDRSYDRDDYVAIPA